MDYFTNQIEFLTFDCRTYTRDMRKLFCLSLFLMCFQASAEEHRVDFELDVFGVSYHSNRTYDFNERNYGVGVNCVLSSPSNDHLYLVFSAGSYKDSYGEAAAFAVAGLRVLLGEREGFHTTASLQAGYLNGSGAHGQGIIPVVSFGYDWVDLCVTGNPFKQDNGDKYDDETRMVAAFVKFRVWEF